MTNKIYKVFITIILILVIYYSFNVKNASAKSIDLHQWMIKRAGEVNAWYCTLRPELTKADILSYEELYDRTKWIIQYAEELNYLYPEIHPRRIAKDFFAVVEFETHFVNYKNMDDGKSFGITALTWQTTQAAIDFFGYKLDVYRKDSNGKIYYNEYHRNLLRGNPELQIKFGIWYYYKLLSRYYNGDRLVALTGYNVGPGLDVNGPRFRNYYFNIRGRLEYYEDEFQKRLQEMD